MQIFLWIGGKECGPFSLEQVYDMQKVAGLASDTLAWTAGQPDFVSLATNRPSYLWPAPLLPDAQRVAEFPKGCRYDFPTGPDYLTHRQRPLSFAISREFDNGGRLLLLADHSIFINEMMLPSDNGNVEFTYNCLEWLRRGPEVRNQVLFVDEGRIKAALWPNEVPSQGTFNQTVSKARGCLGADPDGNPHLPWITDGSYRLGPWATTDYAQLECAYRRRR